EGEDVPAVPGEHFGQLDDEFVFLALGEAVHQDYARPGVALAAPAPEQRGPVQALERDPCERIRVLLSAKAGCSHAERIGVLRNRLQKLENVGARSGFDGDPIRREGLRRGYTASARQAVSRSRKS